MPAWAALKNFLTIMHSYLEKKTWQIYLLPHAHMFILWYKVNNYCISLEMLMQAFVLHLCFLYYTAAHEVGVTVLSGVLHCKMHKNVPAKNISINTPKRCLADEDVGGWCHGECFCSCVQEEREPFIILFGFMHQINSGWCEGCVACAVWHLSWRHLELVCVRVCACMCVSVRTCVLNYNLFHMCCQ